VFAVSLRIMPPVWRLDGSSATAAEVFADTCTDALVVLHDGQHDGQLVAERYDDGMTAATPHLLMSVSKSLVGCVAGVLADRGLLDPAAPATAYVPEAGSSGYAGATIRHLLDMRTGVAFRETYTELDAEVRVMERSMGWRPAQPGDPAGAYPYLTTLGQAGPHGGEFTYRSADSDTGHAASLRRAGRAPGGTGALSLRPVRPHGRDLAGLGGEGSADRPDLGEDGLLGAQDGGQCRPQRAGEVRGGARLAAEQAHDQLGAVQPAPQVVVLSPGLLEERAEVADRGPVELGRLVVLGGAVGVDGPQAAPPAPRRDRRSRRPRRYPGRPGSPPD
jgi:hypothetical protein